MYRYEIRHAIRQPSLSHDGRRVSTVVSKVATIESQGSQSLRFEFHFPGTGTAKGSRTFGK